MPTNPNPITGLPLSGGTLTGPLTASTLTSVNGLTVQAGGAAITGSIDSNVAGGGFRAAEGSNAKQGTAVLAAGTVIVANTSVTANSRIVLTAQALGTVSAPSALCVSARTPGTSFTILASQATDTSTVAYEIFEPG